jgi:hypothetical protein
MSPSRKDRPRVSPKVAVPTAVLAALGVLVCVLDQAGVIDVGDELWIALLTAGGVTFGVGYRAKP